jgi:hypothetical protein
MIKYSILSIILFIIILLILIIALIRKDKLWDGQEYYQTKECKRSGDCKCCDNNNTNCQRC